MSKLKDGFWKDKGILSDSYVLLAGGGHKAWGNASDNIPVSNGTVNTNLNADLLDGVHKEGLFTEFSNQTGPKTRIIIGDTTKDLAINADQLDGKHLSELFTDFSGGGISSSGNVMSQANHSITIGGVTKTAGSSTANIINSLSVSTLTSNSTTNLTVGITVNGVVSANKTLTDLYARDSDKLDGVHASGLFTEFSSQTGPKTRIIIGGTTKDLAINADQLDGKHLNELFTDFSGGGISSSGNTMSQANHSITIGGVTKTAGSSTANIINSLSVSTLTSNSTTNLTIGITVNGVASANKTLADLYARDSDKLDGVHASGLFTEFTNQTGPKTRIIIGGTTKDLAINADQLDGYHEIAFQRAVTSTIRDFTNGTFIETDINYNITSGDPFYMEIKGNVYGRLYSCFTQVQGYIYNDTIINYGVSHIGIIPITDIVAMMVNNHLCFWFPRQSYWEGYSIFCSTAYDYRINRVISVTDSTKPSGTKEVNLSANTHQNISTENGWWANQRIQTSAQYKTMPYVKYVNFTKNGSNTACGWVGAGSSGNDNIGLYGYSGSTLSLGANNNQAVYIDTSCNIGINTSSPTYKLHVNGNAMFNLGGNLSPSTGASFNQSYSFNIVKSTSEQYGLHISILGSGCSLLQSSDLGSNYYPISLNPLGGNVGIGTSSPSKKLHVYGTTHLEGDTLLGNATYAFIYRDYGGASGLEAGFYFHSSGRESVVFANQYAHTGWIFVNGIKPSTRTQWNNLGVTPALQIHHNAIYINRTVRDADTSDWNLYVEGTGYFSNKIYINRGDTNAASLYWNKNGSYYGGIGYGGAANINVFGPANADGSWNSNYSVDRWEFRGKLGFTNLIYKTNYRFFHDIASYVRQGSSTGTICITLPMTAPSHYDMIYCKIAIYEYTDVSASEILFGGHNWNGAWYNARYSIRGNYQKGIRLAHNGSKWCILLGTITTAWSYIAVYIKDLYTQYDNYVTDWLNETSISLITDETGYTIASANTNPGLSESYSYSAGFVKTGSSNSYVLLGGGGHATISGLSVNYANSSGNADTVDGHHAERFAYNYANAQHNGESGYTLLQMAADTNSNSHQAMLYSPQDNPVSASGNWIHVWSQTWNRGVTSSWVSQIALACQQGNGMYYRTTAGNLLGKTWNRVYDTNYHPNADNADTVDGLHAYQLVPRQDSSHFYPFIGSSYGQPWYKVTLPWNGYTSGSNSWMMTTMEIVLGGSYSSGNNGRIYLQYYFLKNSSNNWSAQDVRGITIGYRIIDNGVTIKYDIANPGIFYVKANTNIYNSIGIENVTANDTAPGFDFRNTTIEAIAESSVPSSANQTVSLYHTLTQLNWTSIVDGRYLPLAGGTMSGIISWNNGTREILRFSNNDSTWTSGLKYSWSSNTSIAFWAKNANTAFAFVSGIDATTTDINACSANNAYGFQIYGGSGVNAIVRTAGKLLTVGAVGIGTDNTYSYKLNVNQSNSDWAFHVYNSNSSAHSSFYTTHGSGYGMWCGISTTSSSYYLAQFRYGTSDDGSGGTAAMYIRGDGNIGIGHDGPTQRLDVLGNIQLRWSSNSSYWCNMTIDSTTWMNFTTNCAQYYFDHSIYVNGAIWRYNTNYGIASDGKFYAHTVYANRSASSTAGGVSLYSTSDPLTEYGITFRGTSQGGTHGLVTGDWATYLTMDSSSNRGWIFRSGGTNYASISARGESFFNAVGHDAYIAYPNDGIYTTTTSSITGALKIVIPIEVSKYGMIRFNVEIYNYSTGTSTTYTVGGHNWHNGSGTYWYNEFAYSNRQGIDNFGNKTVRFGSDGSKYIVWIGEVDSVWSYPQIAISNVLFGYSHKEYSNYAKGWQISFATSFNTVNRTITNPATNYLSNLADGVRDANDRSQTITFSYSSGGFSSNPSWLGAWNGYHLTYVSPGVLNVNSASYLRHLAKTENECVPIAYDAFQSFRCTNSTTGFADGYIISWNWSSGSYVTQLFTDVDANYALCYRYRDSGGAWASWKRIPMGDGTGASGTWPISITGNADTVDSEHASAFAHRQTYNNMIHSGNEYTWIAGAYNGDVWINYRTASGTTDGNITGYIFGNGKGGQLAKISSNTFYGNITGNADTVDGHHAERFAYNYANAQHNGESGYTLLQMAADTNSNSHQAMLYSPQDNPVSSSGNWIHVWSQTWNRGVTSSWVSQIALACQQGNGMYYRTTAGNLLGKTWNRVYDTNYHPNADNADNADKLDGYHETAFQRAVTSTRRDFTNGTFIETDINYNVTSGDPFYMEIKGNVYGRLYSCFTQVQGYIYNNTIINYGVSHIGIIPITGIVAMMVNNHLCFWFPRQSYWEGYSIFCSTAYDYRVNRVISVTDSTKPSGTKEVNLSSNTHQNISTENGWWANQRIQTSSSTSTSPTFSHIYMGGYLWMLFGGSWLSTIDNDGNGPIFGYALAANSRRVYYVGSPVYICGGGYGNYASGITVTSNNLVGIGTTSPAEKLHVVGIIRASNGSYYVNMRQESSTWSSFYTNAAQYYFDHGIYVNGALWRYNTNYGIASDGRFHALSVYANRSGSSTDGGVSLYSNSDPMTYGIAFRGTGSYGKLGRVQGDWATYFTMSTDSQRGWIFRAGSTNYASITNIGEAFFSAVGHDTFIAYPNGGTYTTTSSSVTGAIQIKVPSVYSQYSMIKFIIEIYDYNGGGSGHGTSSTYVVGGHNWNNGTWYGTFAYSNRDQLNDKGNLTVRFGNNGTNHMIWIGETNSVWSYPQIAIRDVLVGYTNKSYNIYGSNWGISIVTSFGNVTNTLTNPAINYYANLADGVRDANDRSQTITFSYSSGGFSSNPSWLGAWNGYRLTYVSPGVLNVNSASYLRHLAKTENECIPSAYDAFQSFRCTNSTTGFGDGYIISWDWASGSYVTQLFTDVDANYAFLYRYRDSGGAWASWKRIPMGDGTGASGTWPISITGNADTVDSEHASAFAHRQTYNNMIHSGNEYTWIAGAYNGDVWINYRTASGTTDGNITGYIFGNGKGGQLAKISSNTFHGNITGNADTVDGVHIAVMAEASYPASPAANTLYVLT